MVGETPNLAARLQALAEPGTVVVAEATRRLLGGLFELARPGRVGAQGLRRAGARLARARRGRGRGPLRGPARRGRLTPLVGPRARAGACCSTAGTGRRTARARWSCSRASPGSASPAWSAPCASVSPARPHTWLGQFCSPYHANTALHPVIGLLERAAGLRHEDPPERRLDKLEAMLADAATDVQRDRTDPCRPARHPDRRPLPAPGPEPAAEEGADVPGPARPAHGPGGARAGAGALRGRALGRPDHARAAGPGHRPGAAPAGAGCRHLPARVRPALDRARARHGALPQPPGAAAGRGDGRADDRRQGAPGRGAGADPGPDRRRAAVRRGADQDGARVGPARGPGEPL